jgi:hypothetical protein
LQTRTGYALELNTLSNILSDGSLSYDIAVIPEIDSINSNQGGDQGIIL